MLLRAVALTIRCIIYTSLRQCQPNLTRDQLRLLETISGRVDKKWRGFEGKEAISGVLMELRYYTDYALRVLIYVGLRPNRLCLISEIADAYGISENHLMKVVHGLAKGGFILTYRGKGGGFRLAKSAKDIAIGAVLRHTEGPFEPVECFRAGSKCPISGPCGLPGILDEAFEAFSKVLDRYTLEDILERRSRLTRRLFGAVRERSTRTPGLRSIRTDLVKKNINRPCA